MDGKRRRPVRVFRGAAALLLAVCLLCALAGQALAVNQEIGSPVTVNEPAVIVEGNAVLDSNGQPTGFFELSLKVRTKFYLDADGNPVDKERAVTTLEHPFRSAAVALRYDAKLLTPVKWSYTQEDYIAKLPGVDVSAATAAAPVYLETKKPDNGITASAKAERYTPTDPDTTGPTALLTLSAEAGGAAVAYDRDTTVCVVRFKYDTAALTMDAAKDYAYLAPADSPTGANGKNACVVWFATDVEAAVSTVGQSVRYQGMESMTATAAANRTYYYYYLGAPAMENGLPKTDGAVIFTGPATAKDYASNLLTLQEKDAARPGALQFKLVNAPSYASNGVNPDNLATILFYDWDDTLINVLTVEKGDARAAVNAHIEDTMIHTDLKASTHADNNYMNSIERLYTYRGIYPAEGPSGSIKAADGDEFPLTNKLDYAFYRRPTRLVTPDGSVPGEPTTPYWAVGTNDASAKEAYPYVNGWAVVADIKEIENVWTTFGVGELEDIDPADPGGRFTTSGTPAGYFKLEDFSNLSPGIHYVKACYEPGMLLDKASYYCPISTTPYYVRYGTAESSNKGNAYAIQFTYGRINSTFENGVIRARDPAVRIQYTPDSGGTAGNAFFAMTEVTNSDIMQITISPSASIYALDYRIVDQYNSNYVIGAQMSTDGTYNPLSLLGNYDYTKHTYPNNRGSVGFVFQASWQQLCEFATDSCLTGDWNTVNGILTAEFLKDINLTLADGVYAEKGADLTTIRSAVREAFELAKAANSLDADKNILLDWHQVQYHIVHQATGGIKNGENSILSPSACGGFIWCRLDECAGGVVIRIDNLADLISVARKANDSGNSGLQAAANMALKKLNMDWVNSSGASSADPTGLRLRGGDTGDTFAVLPTINNADLISRLLAFVAAADTAGDSLSNADDAWYQLQYALLNGGAYKPTSGIDKTALWWKTENEKPKPVAIQDMTTLLEAAKQSLDGNTMAWDLLNMDVIRDDLRFRGSITGDALSELAVLSNKADFIAKVEAAVTAAGASYKLLSWYQLQDYVINSTLKADADVSRYLYWWKTSDHKLPVNADKLQDALVQHTELGKLTQAEWSAWMSFAVIDNDNEDDTPGAPLAGRTGLGFRADKTGTHYAAGDMESVSARLRQMYSRAVAKGMPYYDPDAHKLLLTWDQVQYYLIMNTLADDTTAKGQRYEWRPGGTADIPVTITSFEELLLAAKQAVDGDDTSLKTLTLDFVTGQYLRLTGGTLPTARDMDAIQLAAKEAVAKQIADGGKYEDTTWDQIQYAILHPGAAGSQADAAAESASSYYWKSGGKPVSDFATLLQAAAEAARTANPRTAMLNTVTASMVENAPLYLRKDDAGAAFGSLDDFKAAIIALGEAAGSNMSGLTWDQVQYALINGTSTVPGGSVATNESNAKYWWKNGGQKVSDLPSLLEAAYQASLGYGAGLNTVTTDLLFGTPNYSLWFAKDGIGTPYTETLSFSNTMKALIAAIPGGTSYTDLSWGQVQYFIAKGTYADKATADALVDDKTFWWYEGGSKPEAAAMTFDKFLQTILNYGLGNISRTELDATITEKALADISLKGTGGVDLTDGSTFMSRISQLYAKHTKYYKNGVFSMSWDQVQYFIIKGSAALTPASATTTCKTYAWRPADGNVIVGVDINGAVTTMALDMLDLPAEDMEMETTPEEPEIPVIPPVKPEEPTVPEEPEVPVVPPTDPEKPVVPEEPEVPVVPPIDPEEPTVPEEPEVPVVPPIEPEEPTIPEEPESPAISPVDPEIPAVLYAPIRSDGQVLTSLERGGAPIGAEGLPIILLLSQTPQSAAPTQGELSQSDKREHLGVAPLSGAPSEVAALPPPPPRTTLYRRLKRRKRIPSSAIQGGINL